MSDEAHGWRISDRSEAFRAFRWTVERSLRQLDGGPSHEFFTVRVSDFVNVFPVTADEDVVFVRQFRHGLEAPTLEPPGGLVDASDADPMRAGAREMREETGFDAASLEPLGVIHPNPAMLTNRAHFYVARDARRVGEATPEALEDVRTVLIPRAELNDAIADGRITNALIIAGIKLLDQHDAGLRPPQRG